MYPLQNVSYNRFYGPKDNISVKCHHTVTTRDF